MNSTTQSSNRLIQTFCDIVQIDSPTGEEKEMAQEMVSRLAALDIDSTIDAAGNVIAHIPGTGTPLLLNAHLDTVEPGRGIVPVIEDGIIRSQGDTILGGDNKVAIAVMLEAITRVKEQKIDHCPIDLVFTISEEVANIGAIELDTSSLTAQFGYTCDSGDNVGTVTIASPFYNRFDITITGTAAHASRPEQANNVLAALQESLAAISLGRVSENTVCNIGIIEAGHARNTVPGTMIIRGEVRSFVQEELDTVTEQIVSIFQEKAAAHAMDIEVSVVLENDGFLFNTEDSFVQFTGNAIADLGIDVEYKKSSECYDANIFNGKGIQTINIANAVQGMHTIDEHISIESLEQCTDIFFTIISTFGQQDF